MTEIFPNHTPSLDELTNAYLNEAYGLSAIIFSPLASTLLARHIDYDAYLNNSKNNKESKEFSAYLTKQNGIIYSEDKHSFFKQALHSAHLSSCCELLKGHSYTKLQLESSNFSYFIQNWLNQFNNNVEMIKRLSLPLHTLDAVRTIQILRALSLITVRTPNIRQLSIGAGPAEKDITALHSLSDIQIKYSKIDDEQEFSFNMIQKEAESIIISDNDPQRKEQCENLSNADNSNILGLNIDTYEALTRCGILYSNKKQGPEIFLSHCVLITACYLIPHYFLS